MLLGKLKLKTSKIKLMDESVHFHLDEEEQQIALQAKKQLEAFSQEVFDDVRQSEILNSTKQSSRKTNLRESTMTRATQNETRSFYNKPSNRTTREKSSCKCRSPSKKQTKCQKSVSPKKETNGLMSSIKLQGNFICERSERQKYRINRYFNKMQVSNQRKIQRSGLYGVTFRSHTLQPEPKDSLKNHRLYTSKRQISYYRVQDYSSNEANRPYSFNQTMDGVKKYKNPIASTPKQAKMFKGEDDRPSTCRPTGVNLRPQFLRLILRIKEKQQAQCKKKVMAVKGRRNKY